jgi:hypothetical protein
MKLVQRQIAFSLTLALSVMVLGMALPVSAQVAGGGHGGAPRGGTPHGGNQHGGAVEPQEPVEPAETEEGLPEQKYDSLPVDAGLKHWDGKIRTSLRDGKYPDPQPPAQADFEKFYTDYFLSRWSVQEDIRNLHHYRQELASHFRSAVPGQPRDDLTRLTLDMLKKLVVGNFHPAVKINAMLAIGELNSVEASGHVAAVPLPEALDVLIAAAGSNKFSDGVRVAAMVGVLRHVAAGIPSSDAQKKVSDAMLRLVAADVPAGPALSARAWMVAQAVETLGALHAIGENNEMFTAVLKLAADAKLPLAVRCAAADALGHLNYSSANGIDSAETAAALCRLAIDSCKDGLARTKDTASPGFRRRMLCRLDAALAALDGIAPLAKQKPPDEAFVAALQKAITDAIEVLDYKEKDTHNEPLSPNDTHASPPRLKDMKETVTRLQNTLEQLLQKKP